MNEQQLGSDEIYFLDAIGGIDQSRVSIERVEKFPSQGTPLTREQIRRMRRVARKRGRGYTR